ncbi:hypothetical protein A9P82_01610 [Arachidicoccus ginsenosidimutans]|uniref:glycosyltransferase n=1 Tax=Arachidicoccus sp. BS20 TaxID=1850526 RepID=UPI0007F130B7|nr:glycosyltransferase [Arachidicoccus sp. BS20]ANI88120.1 hypothetical protein A9P82_01610 [Arachidicoccus sp. BS20]
MNILFAGKFDPDYNRTKIIIDGLKYFPEINISFYNYSNRLRFNPFRFRKLSKEADVIFMPSFTHLDVPLIRLFTKKPIIFDPLISRYLSKVFDYKTISKNSPRALKNFLKDKLSMQAANIVLCDTEAHKNYYHSTIGIAEKKLHVLRVGVNTDEYFPKKNEQKSSESRFIVGFYGSFVPLQGAEKIVEAAKLLFEQKDIYFKLIGSGFEFERIKHLALNEYRLDNVEFTGWIKEDELANEIDNFDIALGIFGDSLKTDLVIPNKIYHYAAMQKAIVTKDTQGIREIFSDKKNIVLCEANRASIAENILALKTNATLKKSISENGYNLIAQEFNHKKIAEQFINLAKELLHQN